MLVSLTQLRKNIFKLADQVISTGIPLEIERKNYKLKLVLSDKKSKLSNLKKQDCIIGDPDELIDLKVGKWEETKNL